MTRPHFEPGIKVHRLALLCLALCWPAVAGCERGEVAVANPGPQESPKAAPSPPRTVAEGASTGGSWGPVLPAKIKVKDGAGKDAFAIKPEDDGAKLVDASEHEIARYTLSGDKLKIKDASDRVLGYVVGPRGHYHLKDPGQKNVLFALQSQSDGDWKLKDGSETLIYKIKKRDYGFEIEDAKESSLAKVKTKNGKVELRDATDHIRYTAGATTVGPLPFVCLGLDQVGDLPLKAGLMIRIALDEASAPRTKGNPER